MDHPVCFIDTETLGLDADVHPVWEVGIITPDGAEHLWQCKVTDRQLALAHPKALEISRFHERYDPVSALYPAVFASTVRSLTNGLHLAGAVVSFDEERLRRLLWAWDQAPAWHYHLIDVEALAVGWIRGAFDRDDERRLLAMPPWKSDELTAALGVSVPEEWKHTALGDARWAKAVYEAVMVRAAQ